MSCEVQHAGRRRTSFTYVFHHRWLGIVLELEQDNVYDRHLEEGFSDLECIYQRVGRRGRETEQALGRTRALHALMTFVPRQSFVRILEIHAQLMSSTNYE